MTLAEAVVKISEQGSQKTISAIEKVGQSLSNVAKNNMKDFTSAVGAVTAGNVLGNALMSLPGQFLDLGKTMFNASVEAESMNARMMSMSKTAAEAAADIQLIKQVALVSPITTKQAYEQALAIKSMGMNVKFALPLLAQLATAKGVNPERLQAITRVMGKMFSGIIPDAEEAITAGLPNLKAKLAEAGLKFDAKGSLVSSAIDTMKALQVVIAKETGKTMDIMSKTTETKLASLQDALENFYIRAGDVLKTFFTPIIEATTKVLDLLTKTDVVGKFLNRLLLPVFGDITKIADSINKKGFSDEFLRKLSDVLAVLSVIPENIKILAIYLGQLIESLLRNLAKTLGKPLKIDQAPNQGFGREALNFLKALFGGVAAPIATGQAGEFFKSLTGFGSLGKGAIPLPEFPTFVSGDAAGFYEQLKKANDILKNPSKDIPKPTGPPGTPPKTLADQIGDSNKKLDLIAQNTKITAEESLRNLTYGGGQLAAQGISAVQMGGYRSVSSPLINATNDIARGVEKIVRGYSNSNNLNFSFRRS